MHLFSIKYKLSCVLEKENIKLETNLGSLSVELSCHFLTFYYTNSNKL